MDLATLDTKAKADAGVPMELRHPQSGAVLTQEDGRPITITLRGQDSDAYRKVQHAIADARLSRTARQKGGFVLTAAGIEKDSIDALVACTAAWDGIVFDGQPLECNADNVRQLYGKFSWMKDQADEFISARNNFFPE